MVRLTLSPNCPSLQTHILLFVPSRCVPCTSCVSLNMNVLLFVVFQVYEQPGGCELPLQTHMLWARGKLLHPRRKRTFTYSYVMFNRPPHVMWRSQILTCCSSVDCILFYAIIKTSLSLCLGSSWSSRRLWAWLCYTGCPMIAGNALRPGFTAWVWSACSSSPPSFTSSHGKRATWGVFSLSVAVNSTSRGHVGVSCCDHLNSGVSAVSARNSG